jgi:hypothetical protein
MKKLIIFFALFVTLTATAQRKISELDEMTTQNVVDSGYTIFQYGYQNYKTPLLHVNKGRLDSMAVALGLKQATLVSGTNIKTINGVSILGSGDLVVSGEGGGSVSDWGDIGGTLSNQTDLQAALDAKVPVTRTITIGANTYDLSENRGFPLAGTDITSGTLSDARLSSNVPLINANNTFTGKNKFFNADTSQIEIGISNTQKLSVRIRPGIIEYWGRNDASETPISHYFNGNGTYTGALTSVGHTSTGPVEFGSTIKFPTGAASGRIWTSDATGFGTWQPPASATLADGTYGEIDVASANMTMNETGYTSIISYITSNQLLTLEMFANGEFEDFATGAVANSETRAVSGDVVYDYMQANLAYKASANTYTATQTVNANLEVNGQLKAPYVNKQLQTLRTLGYNVIAEPINTPFFVVNTNTGLVDGSVRMMGLYLEKDTTLTGVTFFQSVQGDYTADNNNKIGLYSVSGTTATLVASSANDGNVFKGTSDSRVSKAFSAPYAAAAGLYYVVVLWNNSANTTTPALFSSTGSTAQQILGLTNSLSLGYSVASQTDLPATVDLSTATKLNNKIYLAVY